MNLLQPFFAERRARGAPHRHRRRRRQRARASRDLMAQSAALARRLAARRHRRGRSRAAGHAARHRALCQPRRAVAARGRGGAPRAGARAERPAPRRAVTPSRRPISPAAGSALLRPACRSCGAIRDAVAGRRGGRRRQGGRRCDRGGGRRPSGADLVHQRLDRAAQDHRAQPRLPGRARTPASPTCSAPQRDGRDRPRRLPGLRARQSRPRRHLGAAELEAAAATTGRDGAGIARHMARRIG